MDERVEERARAWGVAVERTLETETSAIAIGTRDGVPVVLKVLWQPGDEWRSGEVLEAFGGRGCVRAYEHVEGALLLERLIPGTPLADLSLAGRDDEATEILAGVIGRMSPHPSPASFVSVEEWGGGFDRYLAGDDRRISRELVEQGRETFLDLCATQRRARLLHGDLQHYNVLFDARRGWLAIDPKGVVGEVEYEVGAALRNPIDRPELFTAPQAIEGRVRRYASILGLDEVRVLAWGFAQAVLSALWLVEDGHPVPPDAPSLRLANAMRPMVG